MSPPLSVKQVGPGSQAAPPNVSTIDLDELLRQNPQVGLRPQGPPPNVSTIDLDELLRQNPQVGQGAPSPPEHPGYWQELWQQSGIPGLVEGLKTHPADTVASAIGSIFQAISPPFQPGPLPGEMTGPNPTIERLSANLSRSPQSAGAAVTLAALPIIATTAGPALGAIADTEAAQRAAAAAKGGITGAAKAVVSPSTYHGALGAELAGEVLGVPRGTIAASIAGARIAKAGYQGAKSALAARLSEMAEAANKTPGQTLAEESGLNWAKVSTADKQTYEDVARARANTAAQAQAATAAPAATAAAPPAAVPLPLEIPEAWKNVGEQAAKQAGLKPDYKVLAQQNKANQLANFLYNGGGKLKAGEGISYADALSMKNEMDFWLQAAKGARITPPSAATVHFALERLKQLEQSQTIQPPAGFSLGAMKNYWENPNIPAK